MSDNNTIESASSSAGETIESASSSAEEEEKLDYVYEIDPEY